VVASCGISSAFLYRKKAAVLRSLRRRPAPSFFPRHITFLNAFWGTKLNVLVAVSSNFRPKKEARWSESRSEIRRPYCFPSRSSVSTARILPSTPGTTCKSGHNRKVYGVDVCRAELLELPFIYPPQIPQGYSGFKSESEQKGTQGREFPRRGAVQRCN
jgi:hypothetical protein